LLFRFDSRVGDGDTHLVTSALPLLLSQILTAISLTARERHIASTRDVSSQLSKTYAPFRHSLPRSSPARSPLPFSFPPSYTIVDAPGQPTRPSHVRAPSLLVTLPPSRTDCQGTRSDYAPPTPRPDGRPLSHCHAARSTPGAPSTCACDTFAVRRCHGCHGVTAPGLGAGARARNEGSLLGRFALAAPDRPPPSRRLGCAPRATSRAIGDDIASLSRLRDRLT
jgi:hypothetical protein